MTSGDLSALELSLYLSFTVGSLEYILSTPLKHRIFLPTLNVLLFFLGLLTPLLLLPSAYSNSKNMSFSSNTESYLSSPPAILRTPSPLLEFLTLPLPCTFLLTISVILISHYSFCIVIV